MLSIISHQGHANQNHNEIALHIHEDVAIIEKTDIRNGGEDVEKSEPVQTALLGVEDAASALKNSLAVPQKVEHGITI